MPSDEIQNEVRNSAARLEACLKELLLALTRERQVPTDEAKAAFMSEFLNQLRMEDSRREQAYLLIENRVEHITRAMEEFMVAEVQRKELGRELIEQRAENMSLQRELRDSRRQVEKMSVKLAALRRSLAEVNDTITSVINSRTANVSNIFGSKLLGTVRLVSSAVLMSNKIVDELEMDADDLLEDKQQFRRSLDRSRNLHKSGDCLDPE
jgi:hypothetical protein